MPSPSSPPLRFPDRLVLWVAQGFGSGRLPAGPGTWGSVVGVLWLVGLLSLGSALGWAVGTLAGLALSVVACSRAETLLGRTDPPSVVIDEIAALPLTFLGPWVALGSWPADLAAQPSDVFQRFWPELLTGFLAFRVFDIAKPGPIGRLQSLPRGWGVTADDIAAALAAAVVTGLATLWRQSS